MYHMIAPHRPGARFNKLRVPPERFAQQISALARRASRFAFASELFTPPKGSDSPTVCITFDDGYADNLLAADPILAAHNARATLYLVADRSGGWSSKKKAHHADDELASEPKLTDDQVRDLLATGRGNSAGTPSPTPTCPRCPTTRPPARSPSPATFDERFGVDTPTFAYPFGHFEARPPRWRTPATRRLHDRGRDRPRALPRPLRRAAPQGPRPGQRARRPDAPAIRQAGTEGMSAPAATTALRLSERTPFAVGGRRLCFVHPNDPSLCVKVNRRDDQRFGRLDKKGRLVPARLRRGIDDNRQERRSLTALRRRLGDRYAHFPRCHGVCDTDLGDGLVIDLLRDADGRISRSIRQTLCEGVALRDLKPAFDRFGEFLLSHNIVTRALLDHNLVARHENDGSWTIFLIDGYGDPAFIPVASVRTSGRNASADDSTTPRGAQKNSNASQRATGTTHAGAGLLTHRGDASQPAQRSLSPTHANHTLRDINASARRSSALHPRKPRYDCPVCGYHGPFKDSACPARPTYALDSSARCARWNATASSALLRALLPRVGPVRQGRAHIAPEFCFQPLLRRVPRLPHRRLFRDDVDFSRHPGDAFDDASYDAVFARTFRLPDDSSSPSARSAHPRRRPRLLTEVLALRRPSVSEAAGRGDPRSRRRLPDLLRRHLPRRVITARVRPRYQLENRHFRDGKPYDNYPAVVRLPRFQDFLAVCTA